MPLQNPTSVELARRVPQRVGASAASTTTTATAAVLWQPLDTALLPQSLQSAGLAPATVLLARRPTDATAVNATGASGAMVAAAGGAFGPAESPAEPPQDLIVVEVRACALAMLRSCDVCKRTVGHIRNMLYFDALRECHD